MPVLKVNIQKAFKRVLPGFFTLAITLTAVFGGAVHASAVEVGNNSGWFDILDYAVASPSAGGNFFSFTGHGDVQFKLPFMTNLFHIDILLYATGGSNLNVSVLSPVSSALTTVNIGDGLYRVYGDLTAYNYSDLTLYFTMSGTMYITMYSCRVNSVKALSSLDIGSAEAIIDTPEKVYFTQSASQGAPGSSLTMHIANSMLPEYSSDFTYAVWCNQWRKYDYMDFYITLTVDSITSIEVYSDNKLVPFSHTLIENNNSYNNQYSILVRVDLTGIDRSADYTPVIMINGKCGNLHEASSRTQFTLGKCIGFVYVDTPSPLVYWFTSLFSKLGTWFNGVVNTVSSGFNNVKNWLETGFQSVVNKLDVFINGSQAQQDTADQIQGAVDDYNDQMQGVNRPDVNDDQFDVDTVIGADNLTLSISLFSSIAQNEVASSMIVIVVIFMLGSYVLFGKKA